jgi:hypothetical protein
MSMSFYVSPLQSRHPSPPEVEQVGSNGHSHAMRDYHHETKKIQQSTFFVSYFPTFTFGVVWYDGEAVISVWCDRQGEGQGDDREGIQGEAEDVVVCGYVAWLRR